MLEGDFALIGKIVFLTCGLTEPLAGLEDREENIKNASLAKERGFLMGVLSALNAKNVRPKIVGWDNYISALPHVPSRAGKGQSSIYQHPRATKNALTKDQISANAGRKIGQEKRYGLIDKTHASKHKRTFWIAENGDIRIEAGNGWSESS